MTAKTKTITEAKAAISKGQATGADASALLRARNPLLWVSTREEGRVELALIEAAASAGYKSLFWDVAAGITDIAGREPGLGKSARKLVFSPDDNSKTGSQMRDPGEALAAVKFFSEKQERDDSDENKRPERFVWVFRDLPVWLDGSPGATPLRQLRNLSRALPSVPRSSAQAVIVLTPSSKVPADLAGHATLIDWPLPDRSEIEKTLVAALNSLPETLPDADGNPQPVRERAVTPASRELAIDAAVGLTAEEAASCYAKSLVQTRTIDPAAVMIEKKRVISKSNGLEWHDPIPEGLDAIGGLDAFKSWIKVRKSAYSPAARAYGLPAPKGVVLVGMSGCGKSLSAKCVATALEVPLLRLDLGALKAKYVGDSEGAIRNAFKIIETIDKCVVWIDEVEKAMAGASSGAADGGVSADALGVVLNWMQERKSNAFVIATANGVDNLPPELFRKGRFDEIFYVGFPNDEERASVIEVALRANGRAGAKIDIGALVKATDRFTGAEIAELIPTALYVAYADGARALTTQDLIDAAKDVNPLSETKKEVVAKIEQWGRENARSATSKLKPAQLRAVTSGGRNIDLD